MKNVTITMEEEVARWARVTAAKHEMSLSRFVGELLREKMHQADAYEQAMRAFLSAEPTGDSGGKPYPNRAQVHDRAALRR